MSFKIGDRVAVGEPLWNERAGQTTIYELDNTGSWMNLGNSIPGEAADDDSGTSVSLNATGDRVAIGAPFNDGAANRSGHVRIFEWKIFEKSAVRDFESNIFESKTGI